MAIPRKVAKSIEESPALDKKLTAKRVIVTSFLVDVLDIILNLTVVVITGSVVMFTELLEGIADLTASGLLLVGLRRSMHKEDKHHPFGYGKEIYIWTLLAGLIMFGITAMLSIYFGWQRFRYPQEIHSPLLAVAVLAITLSTNLYAFYLSLSRLLRKRSFKSIIKIFYRSSLVETKTTFILDLMGTSAATLGLVALSTYLITGDGRFDGIGAMVIGGTLGLFSILLLMGIGDLIVGRSASAETELKIRRAALSIDEVNNIIDLKTMYIGTEKLLVNLDVNMSDELNTDQIEKLIDKIKDRIREIVPTAKYIQIELETPRKQGHIY